MSDLVVIKRNQEVVEVRLNRPEQFNALNPDLTTDLFKHLLDVAKDDAIRAVVISGEGKAFCSGGDLKWMTADPRGPSTAVHELAAYLHLSIMEIRRMTKPVIAAISGVAAGGGFSLALACDFRVMTESAILRQVYTSHGLSLDGGGTFTLPRLVGMARAMEIAAFDKPISAKQALDWGLATKVVKDGMAEEESLKMARELSEKSMHSFGWAKRLLNDSYGSTLETQLERERQGIVACLAHADGIEGINAFNEKRKPVFFG